MRCRHCGASDLHPCLDLGEAPPSNAYLTNDDAADAAERYPLRVLVCGQCWLVQTEDFAGAEAFFTAEYAYFSSTTASWMRHAAAYADAICDRLALTAQSRVVEVASNDGYLLRNFVSKGIPCLGIEPTASTAAAAEALGIPVRREFFGERLGAELAAADWRADLVIGNNVFAHVPDINDFTRGLKAVLKAQGTITLEFPHVLRLVADAQFDTVYHEHFSYLSLTVVDRIFRSVGLAVWDVESLPTHGGSLRVYGAHVEAERSRTPAVEGLLAEEEARGITSVPFYQSLQSRANAIRDALVDFLREQRSCGRTVAAYGAAAKGNTLLNYAGVTADLLPFVCDAAPSKQGKFLPGSRIPIVAPAALYERRPDVVLILPWNIADEVRAKHARIREWGGRFAVAVPALTVWEPQ